MSTATLATKPAQALPPALTLPMQELLAKVLGLAREQPLRQLMLVGVAAQVGSSFVAGHWAGVLAAGFGRVLLVEVTPHGAALPAEPPPAAPGQAVVKVSLSPQAWPGQAGNLLPAPWLQAFGLVLWDVPPLTASPLALTLAREVDGIVLVARSYRTRRPALMHAAARLQDSGGRLLGVVLNRSLNYIPAWLYRLL